jgi:kynurenine 3-monooxygenase
MRSQPVTVVGAGLAGPLLAVLLARRGFEVTVYERRDDPRASDAEAGRSINLALAARGIRALERAGVMDRIRPLMIAMRGRMVHEAQRPAALQPYGQRAEEVIYSVGRGALNRLLVEQAARYPNVTLRFDQRVVGFAEHGALRLRDEISGRAYEAPQVPVMAADGAGSAVRASLAALGRVSAREDLLDHDYKELSVPCVDGCPALEPGALHVWPRHGFMLIALPNTDGTFTATLFLPREGPRSFASLESARAVRELFAAQFADFVPLVPDLLRQFQAHPQGRLGTVHAAPWHSGASVLLLGDAAHAIVPFHGQGMNAAFEDCSVLDALLDRHDDWEALFDAFETERRPNAEAIARMAIENYGEMRESVLDPKFLRQKAWALELERNYPDRFIPRYAMVMFHPEISYAEALRRGAAQQRILDALYERAAGGERFDEALAREMILED